MHACQAVPAPTPIISHRRTTTPEDMIDYITVSDPVIHADGMNKYTSYRVDCHPSSSSSSEVQQSQEDVFLQNNNNNYSSVLRRYTDFKWLYDTLQREKSGAIHPTIA
jgi:sorting nexin-1/2